MEGDTLNLYNYVVDNNDGIDPLGLYNPYGHKKNGQFKKKPGAKPKAKPSYMVTLDRLLNLPYCMPCMMEMVISRNGVLQVKYRILNLVVMAVLYLMTGMLGK